MRAVFLLVLGLVLLACGGPVPSSYVPGHPSHTDSAVLLASRTVALVRVSDDGDVGAYCSGVWVSRNAIMTANHCLRGAAKGEALAYVVQSDVYAPGSHEERASIPTHGAIILALDTAHDVALLRAIVPPAHSVALLSLEPIEAGMHVHAMGHPLGLWFSFSTGDVAAIRWESGLTEKATLMVQTTTPISPGSSGGGLFDEWGQLVGICHASYTRGQNANLFIHRQYLAALMLSGEKG